MAVLSEAEYIKKRTAVIAEKGNVKECCGTQGNLRIKEANKETGDVTLSCKICGVNHYVMKASGMKTPMTIGQTASYTAPVSLPFDPSFTADVGMA